MSYCASQNSSMRMVAKTSSQEVTAVRIGYVQTLVYEFVTDDSEAEVTVVASASEQIISIKPQPYRTSLRLTPHRHFRRSDPNGTSIKPIGYPNSRRLQRIVTHL